MAPETTNHIVSKGADDSVAIENEPDPFILFEKWYAQAAACPAIDDHTAMTLATADASGQPDARMVLLKHWDRQGFVFYTNLGSGKARQLTENPAVALCFYWAALEKQVRVRGPVAPVSEVEADAYYASRERMSQIGAWASKQSQPLQGRFELERRIAKYVAKFGTRTPPRPAFWSGFRVSPLRIEFWFNQPYRLHDRVLYEKKEEGWIKTRLFP